VNGPAPGARSPQALLAAARAALATGRQAEAERCCRRVLEHGEVAEAYHLLAGVQAGRGEVAEAEASYRRVLELAPGAGATRRALAVLLLSLGRYEEGFALFEARHELPQMGKPDLPFPEWRGEPVTGRRLLIWPEQGFGDQIMFARFAAVLKGQGADVVVLCRPGLVRLFEASLGVEVLAAAGAVEFPDPDLWVMTGSLAARLGVTPQTIPAKPYLRATGRGPDLGAGFKVGFMARGNPEHENDANRSLPAGAAARLAGLPAHMIDLDPAATGARDFADTAAILDRLHLVICVDTAVAHLAGAMGKPCWVLLPAEGVDWRWMRERTDSPWYPTLRLYRQRTAGDWEAVLDRVDADLRALVPKARSGS